MTSAVYYEAGQESLDGQRAVAQVVLNRVRHPAFPANVCGVVYEGSTRATGCQFTFTCDGSLMRGRSLVHGTAPRPSPRRH
ncbi:cell wall hydrolase [Sphingomonas daechungensis]|uniref:cell wall hydrolase n=1 Tax=Sphingomonas daechungensis TaxID=1176646 RepID=UPI0037DA284D